MTASLLHLRRAFLGVAFAGSLGFGASLAVAAPGEDAAARYCPARGYPYAYAYCGYGCPNGRGYCDENGVCQCGDIP